MNNISEVAAKLGRKATSLGPVRATLIHKGFIYAPDYGKVCFTVPHFDRFLGRAYPTWNADTGTLFTL